MKWYKNLYMGEIAAKKHYKLLKTINKRWLSNAYIIALPSNSDNVLDIYSNNELLQKYYKNRDIFVVGLAYGKDEALELVKDIIWEVYQATGSVKVNDYIRKMEDFGTCS